MAVRVSIRRMLIATTQDEAEVASEKPRFIRMAAFVGVGCAITSGVSLLMFEVAIALFIGLGPLFVLFLLSDKTSQFFWKWLW